MLVTVVWDWKDRVQFPQVHQRAVRNFVVVVVLYRTVHRIVQFIWILVVCVIQFLFDQFIVTRACLFKYDLYVQLRYSLDETYTKNTIFQWTIKICVKISSLFWNRIRFSFWKNQLSHDDHIWKSFLGQLLCKSATAPVKILIVSFFLFFLIALPSSLFINVNKVCVLGVDAYSAHAFNNSPRFGSMTATEQISQNVSSVSCLKI